MNENTVILQIICPKGTFYLGLREGSLWKKGYGQNPRKGMKKGGNAGNHATLS